MIAYYYYSMCVYLSTGFHAIYGTFGHNSFSRAPDVHTTQNVIEIISHQHTNVPKLNSRALDAYVYLFRLHSISFSSANNSPYLDVLIYLEGNADMPGIFHSLSRRFATNYIFGNQFWLPWLHCKEWEIEKRWGKGEKIEDESVERREKLVTWFINTNPADERRHNNLTAQRIEPTK